jgi:hypothetical protein
LREVALLDKRLCEIQYGTKGFAKFHSMTKECVKLHSETKDALTLKDSEMLISAVEKLSLNKPNINVLYNCTSTGSLKRGTELNY